MDGRDEKLKMEANTGKTNNRIKQSKNNNNLIISEDRKKSLKSYKDTP